MWRSAISICSLCLNADWDDEDICWISILYFNCTTRQDGELPDRFVHLSSQCPQ